MGRGVDVGGRGLVANGRGAVAGFGLSGTVIFDAEGDLSAFSGDTGEVEIVHNTGHEVQGSGALHSMPGTGFSRIWSDPTDGLPYYPQFGDRLRWFIEHNTLSVEQNVYFGRKSNSDHYACSVNADDDRLELNTVVNGSPVEDGWARNVGYDDFPLDTTWVLDFDWQSTKTLSVWPMGDDTYDATNPLASTSTSRTDFDGYRSFAIVDFTGSNEEAWFDHLYKVD